VDIMMNAYLPDYPQLGLKLGYEQYFGEQVNLFGSDDLESDPYALTVGLNHTPVPLVTWGVDHKQGKHGSDDTRIYVGLNYRFGETLENQINQENVNSLRTFKTGRLDLVERNNVITLDYRRKPIDNSATQTPVATVLSLSIVRNNALADDNDINIVEAIVRDQNGQPLEGAVVIFKDNQGESIGVATSDANGMARLELKSETPGLQTIFAELQVNPSVTQETSVNFTDLAALTQANLSLVSVTDNAVANSVDTNQFNATLLNIVGNPLANVNINFVDGDGNVVATGTTDANGVAKGFLTSSIAGTKNITAVVAGTDARSNTEPTTFIPAADPQDAAQIEAVTLIDGALANGKSTNTVKATVLNDNNERLAGIDVEFLDENNKVIGTAFTNNQGIATIQIPSQAAGNKPITARVARNINVQDQTVINFIDESLLQGGELLLVTVINKSPADGVTENTVEATVKDKNGNPASNVLIDFINKITGEVIATGTTDATGKAIGKIASTTSGDIQIEAVISGSNPLIKSPEVTTTFIADAKTAKIASVIPQTTTLNADGQSTTPFEILVTDANGNILANYPIESITDSTGNIYTGPFVTGENGKVTVDSLPSTTPGTVTVTATLANRSTGSGEIEFVQSVANASITIAADKPVVVADGTGTTMARGVLADEFGNPIANQEIDVEITLEGETTTTRVTTGPQGEYSVAVPSNSTVGAIANITATTVNLPTNISASTSVLYNGDITTKQLTFNVEKTSLVANQNVFSSMEVTVTDASGRIIINEEVIIKDTQTGTEYKGITNTEGKFIAKYLPYDPNGTKRFEPSTDVVFEANFVNDPKAPKTDQLRLTYGAIQTTAKALYGDSGFVVGIPVEIPHTLQQRQNNIDLATGSFKAVLEFSEEFDLQEGTDYTITTSSITLTAPTPITQPRIFESIVTITFLDTTKATNFLNNGVSFLLIGEGWYSESIDPNDYFFAKNEKEVFINY
ncbi:Ig-like domain-containing protein, partial [Thorsellia anophelis]